MVGDLSKKQLEGILHTLHVEFTFVDDKDLVRFTSKDREDALAIRADASTIGSPVINCHKTERGKKSVSKLLSSFRSGKRDKLETCMTLGDKTLYLKWCAVRNKEGNYLGALQTTQDITDIKTIEPRGSLDAVFGK